MFFLLMLDKNSCQIWGHQVKFVKAQVEKCLLTSVAFADNVALHLLVLMTASCIKAKMIFSIRAALSDATVAKSIFYVQSVVQGLYEHIQTACLNNSAMRDCNEISSDIVRNTHSLTVTGLVVS